MACFIIIIISLMLQLLLSSANEGVIVREPWVEHFHSFFSPEDCTKIIQAAEAFGFPNSSDSIDYLEPRSAVSWAIDVYVQEYLEAPSIALLYEKYLPKLRDLVADRKFKMNNGDTSEPSLDWVFLRKYTAGAERQMLKLHHDTNLFTVNVALNDDYRGGGLFYHNPNDSYYYDEEDPYIPLLPDSILGYDYLETVKRKNTSELKFPIMETGDLLIHNYTLWHAIAPIEQGTRYSLVFFYDTHHPHVRRFLREYIDVTIENYFDIPVDLYAVDSDDPEYSWILIHEDIKEDLDIELTTNDEYLVVNRETGEVVEDFVVQKNDYDYEDDDGENYPHQYVAIGLEEDEEGGIGESKAELGKEDLSSNQMHDEL